MKRKFNLDFNSRLVRQSFYRSKEWLLLRSVKLNNNPLCEVCLKNNKVKSAQDIHHIKDIKDRPDLRLDYSNLQSLCYECHNNITITNQFNSEKNLQPVNKVHKIPLIQLKKPK